MQVSNTSRPTYASFEIFNNFPISDVLENIIRACFSNGEIIRQLKNISIVNQNCRLTAHRIKITLLNEDMLKIINNGNKTDIIDYIILNHTGKRNKLSFLRIENFNGNNFEDYDIKKIKNSCPELFLIHEMLGNNDFTTMANLACSSTLTKLDLSSCWQIKFNILKFANLTNLTHLDLCNSSDTLMDLQELIKLKKLTNYSFANANRYLDCEEFTQLTNLTKLKFYSDPEFLDKLALFTNLTKLTLRPYHQNRSDFSKIYEFTHLTYLNLNKFERINNIESISKLIKLSSLYIDVEDILDEGFVSIGKLTNLTYLNFSNKEITDKGLESLSELTNLTDFQIGNISDKGLEKIIKFNHLKILSIERFSVTNKDFQHIAQLTNLTDLNMGLSINANDEDLKQLKKLTNLTAINFKFPQVSYAGIRELALCANLSIIEFQEYGCNPITEEAIRKITFVHPNLLIKKLT